MNPGAAEHTRLYVGGRIWSAGRKPGAAVADPWPVQTLAEQGGRIVAVGARSDLQQRFPDAACIDLDGRLVTPGFIDCHTHLVYAGDRSAELERRLAGESYQAIARSGGGILSTVAATAAATVEQLAQLALPRLDALLAEGVTSIEIKSGYGLELAGSSLGALFPVVILLPLFGLNFLLITIIALIIVALIGAILSR